MQYIDDKKILARCTAENDWPDVMFSGRAAQIEHAQGESYYGITVSPVDQLEKIYGVPVYSVGFIFRNIESRFSLEDAGIIDGLLESLENRMAARPGYYIIRIPSHVVSLLSAINRRGVGSLAGGTVCYMLQSGSLAEPVCTAEVRKLSGGECRVFGTRIVEIAGAGFEEYSGQYHVSDFTRPKAGEIYKNWIREFLEGGRGEIFGAFLGSTLVGFLGADDQDSVREIVLNAVSKEARGKKVYESLVRTASWEASRKGFILTASTQMDNFNAQRAWINVGFKPYYSFYLIHRDSTGHSTGKGLSAE